MIEKSISACGKDNGAGDARYHFLTWDGANGALVYGDLGAAGGFPVVEDVPEAQAGDDVLEGGEGNDELYGRAGDDLLDGGSGHDQLQGEGGDDMLFGGDGDDMIYLGSGDDRVMAGITANSQSGDTDLVDARAGNDLIESGADGDLLLGGQGNDNLEGGEDVDILVRGVGADTLDGGTGNDALINRPAPPAGGCVSFDPSRRRSSAATYQLPR